MDRGDCFLSLIHGVARVHVIIRAITPTRPSVRPSQQITDRLPYDRHSFLLLCSLLYGNSRYKERLGAPVDFPQAVSI